MQPNAKFGTSGSHPVVFDPSMWSMLAQQQGYGAPQAMAAPAPQKHKPWYTAAISELGGAGGAAGGAAAGAALGSVVPGVGTAVGGLAGAILGGFLGGTGGKLAENKIRDNKFNVGSALKEGGIDAAFSGAGAGFQALKGARYASNLSKVLPEAGDSLVTTLPPKSGAIERAGYSLKSAAGGYGQGAKLGGDKIGLTDSKVIDDVLNKLKVPAGAPEFRQAQLEGKLSNIQQTLGNIYSKNAQPVSTASLGKNILNDVGKLPFLNSAAKQSAQDFVDSQLKGAKNTNDLWELVKKIDANSIKWGGSPDAKLVDREAVARVVRSNIRDLLNAKLPGVAQTNSLYHDAVNANSLLKDISTNSKGGGIAGKVINLQPVRATESKLGSAIEKTGKAIAGTGTGPISGPASQVLEQAKFQAPASLTRALSGLSQPPSADPNAAQMLPGASTAAAGGFGPTPDAASGMPYYNPSDPFGQGSQLTAAYGGATGAGGAGGDPSAVDGGSPYSQQNLMYDISRDPKHTADYLNLYKTLVTIDQSQAKASAKSGLPGNVGKLSAQQYYSAQQGLQALQGLTQILNQNPGIYNKTNVPGQSAPIVGGMIQKSLGTNTYNTYARNIADLLLRARTGATANSQEINMYMHELMPQAGDPPATAQAKIRQLYQNFQDMINAGGSGGASTDPTDLSSALLQMQGAY